MKLYGEVVKHKFFGRGKIVEFANNYVTVLFDESKEKKKFAYPTAFGSFLELGNKSFLKQIEEDKKVIAKRDAESRCHTGIGVARYLWLPCVFLAEGT